MRVVLLTLFLAFSLRPATSQWVVARSPHFEVYSDAGPDAAARTLTRFEQLRTIFDRYQIVGAKYAVKPRPPIRVIAFTSRSEYAEFQPRPTADAFYTAAEDRDYIVLPIQATENKFGIAAHEYAHFILYSRSLKLPPWFSEGIAELFSTVTISGGRCEFGGPLRARVDVLRREAWLTAGELFAAESRQRPSRDRVSLFYAQSWAVTDMLNSSPEYAPRFADLIASLGVDRADTQHALAKVYGKSADAILDDAKQWIARARSSRRLLPPPPPVSPATEAEVLSDRQSQTLLADLLSVTSQWERAEKIYQTILKASPVDPNILAALAMVFVREDRNSEAAAYFRKALDSHLTDAGLCYRYALLADELGMAPEEIERALQRAISAQADFDDARYKLALIQNNTGRFADAVVNLRAMNRPTGPRAFAYWTSMAFALTELDRREEAKSAAGEALKCASTEGDRARARQLAYVAATDMTVRFVRDVHGNLQLATTRVPHGTADFNPFIEPNDHIETAEGELREVQCKEGRLTGLMVENEKGTLSLSVPDPLHVMIRNGPAQFFCGTQPRTFVKVEYASTGKPAHGGLLRGMEFR